MLFRSPQNPKTPREWQIIVIQRVIMEAAAYRWIKIFARVGLCISVICLGLEFMGESGERVFNKYMHAGRKQMIPSSKPGDASPLGMSFNDLNKSIILAMGALLVFAGVMIMIGQSKYGGTALIAAALFMLITKDNLLLESDVPAIKREDKDRIRWACADVSLIGVALAIIGGLGWVEDEEKVEKKKKKKKDKDE